MQATFYGYKHWTLEATPRCFYVGKGHRKRPSERSNGRRNHKWHAIVKRHGLRIEVCVGPMTHEDVIIWEIANIASEGTFSTCHSHDDPIDVGCNFTRGGEGSPGHKPNVTEKMRRGMSERRRGKAPWNVGTPISEEQRRKLQERVVSHETRLKISRANKGKPTWNKGKTLREETRKKIREARAKQIVRHSPETRQKMREAAKLREAAKRAQRQLLSAHSYLDEAATQRTAETHSE